MKKIKLIFALIAVVMLVGLTNCTKKEQNSITPKYVGTVNGSFTATDGNITFKSFPDKPVGVTRTWKMYRTNDLGLPTDLVDGSEFVTGSIAYEFWHNPVNNPVSFSADQSVYSNLTPLEGLRLTTETKDGNGKVMYLGMLNFNPATQGFPGFPLNVKGYRLGDVLVINTDALTKLPGGLTLAITVDYQLKPVDLAGTEMEYFGGEFSWINDNVHYGAPVAHTSTVGSGNASIYDDFTDKVTGTIVLTIVVDGNTAKAFHVNVPASENGKGMLLKLTTTKIGWYDSATIGIQDNDITVETIEVPIN